MSHPGKGRTILAIQGQCLSDFPLDQRRRFYRLTGLHRIDRILDLIGLECFEVKRGDRRQRGQGRVARCQPGLECRLRRGLLFGNMLPRAPNLLF